MATLAELEQKFMNAHKAGDTRAAKALADEIKRQRAAAPAYTPSPQAAAASKEMSNLTQHPQVQFDPEFERRQFNELDTWKKPLVAGHDILSLIAGAPFFGFGEKAVAGLRAPFTDQTYDEELANQRLLTEKARARSGWAGTAAEIGSQLYTLPSLAPKVPGIVAKVAAPVLEGMGYGALSGAGNDQDILTSTAIGGVGGAGGALLGEILSRGGTQLSKAWADYAAAPTEKAKQALYLMAQKAGIGADEISEAVVRFGPEVMPIDVLGKPGQAATRAATNLSPEGREIAEDRLTGRKLGQNTRLAGDVQTAAGVTPGSRETVQDIIDSSYAARKPGIDAAYDAARSAGYDLPRSPFESVIGTPMGKKAYDDAATSLLNRRGFQGDDAASELARLDQTKRELDSIASTARRSGDNNRAAQAEALSQLLTQRIDETMTGPEYAAARSARRAAFQEENAIQAGADAARSPDIGSPVAVGEFTTDPANLAGLRKGYAQQTADDLLTRSADLGSVKRMSTPLATETRTAVLGDQAPTVENALARERQFGQSERAVTGNSTTARQLAEAAALVGGGGIADWMGPDSMIGDIAGAGLGIGGLLRAGRAVTPYVRKAVATRGVEQTAMNLADLLTQSVRAIPQQRPIPPGPLERLGPQLPEPLKRLGIFGGLAAEPPVLVQ